jgi:hypothetical protein
MMADQKGTRTRVERIHGDAKGQYAKPMKHSENNGVVSAKPRVITGSDDATAHKTPPGQKPVDKWDLNYDERDVSDDDD